MRFPSGISAVFWLCVAAPLACCLGCGEPSPFVPVRGRVTYKGAPVEDVLVVFNSLGEKGRAASDRTDADGRFELTTYVSSTFTAQGALPTDYEVYLMKREPPERVVVQPGAPKSSSFQNKGIDPQEVARMVNEGLADPGDGLPTYRPGKSLIPERYAVANHPVFKVSIEREQEHEFQFDLED